MMVTARHVTGSNSLWSSTGSFYVGYFGALQQVISNGATVHSASTLGMKVIATAPSSPVVILSGTTQAILKSAMKD
jgi:T5SS/PEP-CTERM-associated repeat protein